MQLGEMEQRPDQPLSCLNDSSIIQNNHVTTVAYSKELLTNRITVNDNWEMGEKMAESFKYNLSTFNTMNLLASFV